MHGHKISPVKKCVVCKVSATWTTDKTTRLAAKEEEHVANDRRNFQLRTLPLHEAGAIVRCQGIVLAAANVDVDAMRLRPHDKSSR